MPNSTRRQFLQTLTAAWLATPPAPQIRTRADWQRARAATLGSGRLRDKLRRPMQEPASPPPGATAAMLVATTEAESAELARIFGYNG